MKTVATIILITGLALNAFAGGGDSQPSHEGDSQNNSAQQNVGPSLCESVWHVQYFPLSGYQFTCIINRLSERGGRVVRDQIYSGTNINSKTECTNRINSYSPDFCKPVN